MYSDCDMTGKVVIITGATRGIGEGCVRVFCEAGAKVVACARSKEAGEKLSSEMNGLYGEDSCIFVQCDVTSEKDIQHAVDVTLEKNGKITSLINVAGYHPGEELIDDVSVEMYEKILRLNLTSMFMFCKYALPAIRKEHGTIVNMASLVHTIGQTKSVRYVSSKGAIASFTRAMALDEAKYGVRVNSVSPGCIVTPLTMEYINSNPDPEKILRDNSAYAALDRLGETREVANGMLFLASNMSSFITGIDITISGGAELGYGTKY